MLPPIRIPDPESGQPRQWRHRRQWSPGEAVAKLLRADGENSALLRELNDAAVEGKSTPSAAAGLERVTTLSVLATLEGSTISTAAEEAFPDQEFTRLMKGGGMADVVGGRSGRSLCRYGSSLNCLEE